MADFEGHKFPIAGKYVELMTHYYGDSWDILPEHKKHHSQMSKTDFKCKDYYDDYIRFIDKDSLLKERQEYKHIAVKEGYLVYEHLNNVYTKVGDCVALKIKRKLASMGISINDLLVPNDKEKLAKLDELYSEYYSKQLHPSVRYWEVLFDMDDDLLYGAVFNLVYSRNDLNSFNKIMKLLDANNVTPPNAVTDLWELVLTSRKVKAEIVYNNYDLAEELLTKGLAQFPYSKELKIFRLILDALTAKSEEQLSKAEALANSLLEEYPDNDKCIKALGDIAYNRGNFDEAEKHYKWIMKNSPNGMLHLDIKKKREAIK
jgi:tetratricopeptide (TPR) repeat protein